MRWGDFRPRADEDGVVHRLTVKGGRGRRKHLPKRVWDAILAYLQADGRYQPKGVAPDDEHVPLAEHSSTTAAAI